MKRPVSIRAKLKSLYHGRSPTSRNFRYAMLGIDLATIGIFLLASGAQDPWWLIPVDVLFGLIILTDLSIRIYIDDRPLRCFLSFTTAADILVIISLFLPLFIDNLAFLRVVRALRVLRSYHLVRDLRADSKFFCRNEDVVLRSINLAVFIFVVTSIVFVTQDEINPQIKTYVDALYFTITTLTTTGFGDITLQGNGGRLLAVLIMVVGVSLFLRLLQAIFRPTKVHHECPDCGLLLHDPDSVHCKHCGHLLHIRTEGQV